MIIEKEEPVVVNNEEITETVKEYTTDFITKDQVASIIEECKNYVKAQKQF